MFGAYRARLQWAAVGFVAIGVATILGSAIGFVAWFARTTWAYLSFVVTTLWGFAKGSKTGHDVKAALDGSPESVLI